jgi:hypothetical protein
MGGLQLPGATAAGRCSGSSSTAVGAGFGYNTSSSCAIGMTLSEVSWLSLAQPPLLQLSSAANIVYSLVVV